MRRRYRLGAACLAVGATLIWAGAGRADPAETPESLLQEAAKAAKYCQQPKAEWPKKKVSSNLDSCSDEAQLLVKAIELSGKSGKTIEAASASLTAATLARSASALYVGRFYTESASQEAALGFFRVACTAFDPVASFVKPTPEQTAAMKAVVADTEQSLQGFHRTCKELMAED